MHMLVDRPLREAHTRFRCCPLDILGGVPMAGNFWSRIRDGAFAGLKLVIGQLSCHTITISDDEGRGVDETRYRR